MTFGGSTATELTPVAAVPTEPPVLSVVTSAPVSARL